MSYLSDLYGKRPPNFIKGFLAAMEMYAVWKDGQRFIGSPEKLLKSEMKSIVAELAEVPEDFEEIISFHTN